MHLSETQESLHTSIKERVEREVLFKILLKKVNKTFNPSQADGRKESERERQGGWRVRDRTTHNKNTNLENSVYMAQKHICELSLLKCLGCEFEFNELNTSTLAVM